MRIRNWIFAGFTTLFLASCQTPKNVAYFPQLTEGETLALADTKGIVLKPTDKLSIIVNTKSAELNNVLNMPVTSQIIGYSEIQSINQSRGTSGYTIDPEGYIDFPLVGKVKAAGMTRAELTAHLKKTLEEQNVARDAVVTIEYMNLGFSVMGDVVSPGFYQFNSGHPHQRRQTGSICAEPARSAVDGGIACLLPPAERRGLRRAQQL